MEFDPQDQDIIRLLTKLKDVDGEYPEHMLVAQRRRYLKRMTEIELGISADQGIKNTVENKKPPNGSPATSTLLEIALIVAIVAEAGVVTYFYHDKLADFFQTFTTDSSIQEVTSLPVIPTSLDVPGITPSPATTSTSPLTAASPAETTVTPRGTPIPGVVDDNSNTPGVNQLNSTPIPNGDNGNNGNHYGQTPKPERTKENNGNNDKPPKGEDDKPPKENDDKPPKDNNDKHPKDEPKPTKAQ